MSTSFVLLRSLIGTCMMCTLQHFRRNQQNSTMIPKNWLIYAFENFDRNKILWYATILWRTINSSSVKRKKVTKWLYCNLLHSCYVTITLRKLQHALLEEENVYRHWCGCTGTVIASTIRGRLFGNGIWYLSKRVPTIFSLFWNGQKKKRISIYVH